MLPADQPQSTNSAHHLRRWLDGLLLASMIAAAAVLACQELSDPDTWWHLRSGQWILENRRLPTLDPFSFASADREWIDLHWGFQITLALAHRFGGVAGMIVLASALCGLTLLIAMTARMRDWPAWVVAAAWVPALLVMSLRVPPRPELFSLAFLAAYMAVLLRCDRRPALAWALPAIQVLWVNSHGLFILGPLILGAYVADGALRALRFRGAAHAPTDRTWSRWWMHVGLALVAVFAACLVNPYGARGALLPLELFPKIGAQGDIYKANIIEFYYPSQFLQDMKTPIARRNLFARGEYFLLLMLPTCLLGKDTGTRLDLIPPSVEHVIVPPTREGDDRDPESAQDATEAVEPARLGSPATARSEKQPGGSDGHAGSNCRRGKVGRVKERCYVDRTAEE